MRISCLVRGATLFALALALSFVFGACSGGGSAKSAMPQLQVKFSEGKTTVVRAGEDAPLDAAAVKGELEKLAQLVDEGHGWTGRGPDGISENPLVVQIDAMADYNEAGKLLATAGEQMIYHLVVGTTEYITNPLAGTDAPDLNTLDPGYLKIDLPKDEGLNATPEVPKEVITLYVNWQPEQYGGSYIVALDARGRKPVNDSWLSGDDLTGKTSPDRDRSRENIRDAVLAYIAKAGTRVEKLKIMVVVDAADPAQRTVPWGLVDHAYRAGLEVNQALEKKGLEKLQILLPFQFVVAEPPPPERPPEDPVQYPKDGPTKPDPTEDPTADKPAKDEGKKEDDFGFEGNPAPARTGYQHRRKAEGEVRENEDRVLAALNWLRDHQNKDGYWSAAAFNDDSVRNETEATHNVEFRDVGKAAGDKGWETACDDGLTGLALMAYAGAGLDHKSGDYKATVRSALLYLRKTQDNDGRFGPKGEAPVGEGCCPPPPSPGNAWVYNHAISTLAIAEMYGLSGDMVLRGMLERAVDWILKAQNPGLGWRYGVKPGVNDSCVTCWLVMALHAAKTAGIDFDSSKCFDDAAEWFDMVTVDVNGYPKTGYDSPGSNNVRLREAQEYEHNPTMDAMHVNAMLTMGKADLNDKALKAQARTCVERDFLPAWDQYKIDFHYWYQAGRALFKFGDPYWKKWQEAMVEVLRDHQRGFSKIDKDAKHTTEHDIDEYGSWDPVGAWGSAGGRVYSTAMGCLCLETPWSEKE